LDVWTVIVVVVALVVYLRRGRKRGGWKVLEKLGNEGIAGVFDGDLAEVGRLIDEVG